MLKSITMHKIAVYGSLRQGEYNFERMSYIGDIQYETTTTIQGWDLYSLGMYPAIKKGTGTIVVDILNVGDEVLDFIRGMEFGAGYHEETVNVDGQDCFIYVYNYELSRNQVLSGDWKKQND